LTHERGHNYVTANSRQILRLKCTKFNFGWGSAKCSPDALAGFGGHFTAGEGLGWGRGGKGEGGGSGGEGKGGPPSYC